MMITSGRTSRNLERGITHSLALLPAVDGLHIVHRAVRHAHPCLFRFQCTRYRDLLSRLCKSWPTFPSRFSPEAASLGLVEAG